MHEREVSFCKIKKKKAAERSLKSMYEPSGILMEAILLVIQESAEMMEQCIMFRRGREKLTSLHMV